MSASVEQAMVDRLERWVDEHPDPSDSEREAGMREICVEFGLDPDRPIIIRASKAGRNEPCPCGSGIKFKRCHGR